MWAHVGNAIDAAIIVGYNEKLKPVSLDGDDVTRSDISCFQYGYPLLLWKDVK